MNVHFYGIVSFLLFCLIFIKGEIVSLDERSYPFIFIKGNGTYSDLANGNQFILYEATSATASYRIVSLVTSGANSVNFTGGDRSIYIGTSGQQRWMLHGQSIGNAGGYSLIKSSEGIGINPSYDYIATDETTPGDNIIISYYDGTTDYVEGKLFFSITLFQTVI